jgi:hypothetical protein
MLIEILKSPSNCSKTRRRALLANLADRIRGFKSGIYSTIYLPLAYPLNRLECSLTLLLQSNEAYNILTSILKELQNLREPCRLREHSEIAQLCVKTASHYDNVYKFVDKYLSINRTTMVNIARVLLEQPCIESSLDAICELILENKLGSIFRTCKPILRKSLTKLATIYDTLLILIGVASHYNPIEKAKIALGLKHKSNILRRTIFTQAFIYIMLGAYPVENYVEAYKTLVECTVKLYREPLGYVTHTCSEELEKWRTIGVEADTHIVEEHVRTIYALVNEVLS